MSKSIPLPLKIKELVVALATCFALAFSAAAPASAAPAQAAASVQATVAVAAPAAVPARGVVAAFNPGSACHGLVTLSYRSVYVLAATIGFCPTWAYLNSPWGRPAYNWVVNTACRMPWLVSAITRGYMNHC